LNGNNLSDINNLSLLHEENTSLKISLKLGSDMERQASLINSELETQKTNLELIKDKVYRMYNKLDISNTITNFLIRRGRGDTYLCLFLGVLTFIIIYFIYYYVKPWIRGDQTLN
jgi:hypothetical protein